MKPKDSTVREYALVLLDNAMDRIERDKKKEWLETDREGKAVMVRQALVSNERLKLVGLLIKEEKNPDCRQEFITQAPSIEELPDLLSRLALHDDFKESFLELLQHLGATMLAGAAFYADDKFDKMFENLLIERDRITHPDF